MLRTYQFSEKVSARVGYPDAHVEILVRVPIVGEVPLRIEAHELDQAEFVIKKALEHRKVVRKGR